MTTRALGGNVVTSSWPSATTLPGAKSLKRSNCSIEAFAFSL
jgi:hypothetical protein